MIPLLSFNKRTQALLTVLVVAVLAVVGLLLLMSRLATFETPTLTQEAPISTENVENTPVPSTQSSLEEAVATVNDQIITQQAWQQATRLDAVMSQLAAQPIPTAEETLDRLINEIIVLNTSSSLTVSQQVNTTEVEARIQALETSWHVNDEAVITALAEASLTREDLTDRVAQLIQVETALNQLSAQKTDLNTWLAQARASAEIGLYRSLVNQDVRTLEDNSLTPISQSAESPEPEATPQPSSPAASQPAFAPPPEMAISPYPENAAPDFTLAQLKGDSLTLSAFRGKPTLINFWATWCPPCRRELPALQAAYTAHQDEIGFIAVNVKEDPATVTAMVEELGLDFPIALDTDGQVSNLAYEVRGLPTTIFVDANGVVTARHVGPLDEATIEGYLKPLLEAEPQAETEEPQITEAEVSSAEASLQPSDPLTSQQSPAPDFTLTAASGETISLQDYRGKSNVALIFYRGHT